MKSLKIIITLTLFLTITLPAKAEKLIPIEKRKKLLIGKETKLSYKIKGKRSKYKIKAKIDGMVIPVKDRGKNQIEITIPPIKEEGIHELKIYLISKRIKHLLKRGMK